MTTGESNPYPDNVYFDGKAVSWVGSSAEGYEARYGVIQEGFYGTLQMPKYAIGGERIWLLEPVGSQSLTVNVFG